LRGSRRRILMSIIISISFSSNGSSPISSCLPL
jgi:hypothetical protein